MNKPHVIVLEDAFDALEFVPDRTPESTDEEIGGAFARLAPYRDGALFIGHYAGDSAWERHANGDEIVYVVDGETTLVLLVDGEEQRGVMCAGEITVVPRGTWHRFETPEGVKVLTATPQPTDHSIARPA